MRNIETEIGKIFCLYNEEKDDFDKVRLASIIKDENDDNIYELLKLNEKTRIEDSEDEVFLSEEEFNDIRKNWTLLRSDGILSVTNIVATSNERREIKDVLIIFFPNNRITEIPDIKQPYIVARQGINNIFAEMAGYIDHVGMSVSIDTLPVDYSLSDFMANERVLSSTLTHVYKTDTAKELSDILTRNKNVKESEDILKELQLGRIYYLKNTSSKWATFDEKNEKIDNVDGYCNNLEVFMNDSGFIEDLYNCLGILKIDSELKSNTSLSSDDKLLLSVLSGGTKIDKAVPLAFDYDVNMAAIKMKYFLIVDINDNLWIVAYTESPDEIDVEELYNLNEERTKILQERLSRIVTAYDKSKNIELEKVSNVSVPLN